MVEPPGATLPLGDIVVVYLLFRLKHVMADYFLQTTWMARGKEEAVGWAGALFAHTGVHALGTTAIALAVEPAMWWLGGVDFDVHAAGDRAKATTDVSGRWRPSDPPFWWLHALDQEAHNLTHFAFVIALVLAG